PAVPTVKVALLALVRAGAWLTVREKLCVALAPTPLLAVKVRAYVPPVPAAGVPPSAPVLALNVTPLGRAPVSLKVGAGKPLAVTVATLALVRAGAWSTVRVKLWVAFVPMPLAAVNVTA